MSVSQCTACGETAFEHLLTKQVHRYERDGKSYEWQYDVVQCPNCGLGRVTPTPSFDIIQTFYPNDYGPYASDPEADALDARKSWKFRVAKWRFSSWGSRSLKARAMTAAARSVENATGKTVSFSLGLPLQLPRDAKIFEMGFGSGAWLCLMASLGYKRLAGYDIAANASNLGKLRALGIDVSSGSFMDNAYEPSSYDLIRLEHVFEHLIDPVSVLARCREMLRPGGTLVMTFPSLTSLSTRLSLQHSPNGVEIPRHLFHHTAESAQRIVRAAGFREVDVRVFGDVWSILSTALGKFGVAKPPRALSLLAFAASPFYKVLCDRRHEGELMTVVASA